MNQCRQQSVDIIELTPNPRTPALLCEQRVDAVGKVKVERYEEDAVGPHNAVPGRVDEHVARLGTVGVGVVGHVANGEPAQTFGHLLFVLGVARHD